MRQEQGAKEQERHFCGNKQEKEQPMVRGACECWECLSTVQGSTPRTVISWQAPSRAGFPAFTPFLNPNSQCKQEKSSSSACTRTTHITELNMSHVCVNPNPTYILIFLWGLNFLWKFGIPSVIQKKLDFRFMDLRENREWAQSEITPGMVWYSSSFCQPRCELYQGW